MALQRYTIDGYGQLELNAVAFRRSGRIEAQCKIADGIDYIENGNIVNSVNLPEVTMPRSGNTRVCVIHKNIPNMLTKITALVSDDGINIENLLNKSRGDYAYTMLDIGEADIATLEKEINEIEGVIRVRII